MTDIPKGEAHRASHILTKDILVQDGDFGARMITCFSNNFDLLRETINTELQNTSPHAIYVRVPSDYADILLLIQDLGFQYYTIETEESYVPYLVYYKWCSPQKDRVPQRPSTTTGSHLLIWKQGEDGPEFLAVREGKVWGLVGGKGNIGETLWDTVVREANEEIKFEAKGVPNLVRLKCEIVHDNFGSHQDISAIFSLNIQNFIPKCDKEEIEACRWVSSADVQSHLGDFRKCFVESMETVLENDNLPKCVIEQGKMKVNF